MDKEQEKAAKARESALQNAVGQIERQFGGSIMKMGDDAFAVSVKAISTGAMSLDLALGVERARPRPDRRDLRPRVLR